MHRTALTAGVLLAALAGGAPARAQDAPATVPTSPPATLSPSPLRATLDSCRSALLAADRAATFSAAMPPVSGAVRMRMRFDLYVRRDASAAWRRLVVPKWSIWQVSRPRVPGFVFTKLVDGLDAPASYRALVRFRWYDKRSQVLRVARRTSPTCTLADPRAALEVGPVTAAALSGGMARYTIVVRNDGLSPAHAFGVVLVVGGRRRPPVAVSGLAPGQQRTVTVDGPACASGGRLSIVLDLADAVEEVDRLAAPVMRPCPL